MLVGAALSFLGFIHAGRLSPAGGLYEIGFGTGARWTIGYLLAAGFFALVGAWVKHGGPHERLPGH
jgi:hypothetical protein